MVHACYGMNCRYECRSGACGISPMYGYPEDAACMRKPEETYGDSYEEDWLEDDGEVLD